MTTPDPFFVPPLDATDFTLDSISQWATAGRGNLLKAAVQVQLNSATHLQALLKQAPSLRETLRATLQAHYQVDPYACGLMHGDSQVTLLTFAARVLASPLNANPYVDWTLWGFDATTAQASWTIKEWTGSIVPLIGAARLHAQSDYWDARMPGKSISRRSHGHDLLRQHFQASLDVAVGLDHLATDAWSQGNQEARQFARLEWRYRMGGTAISHRALLIKPRPGETGWLLYRPAANSAVQAFKDRDALLDWAYQHRQVLWSDPRVPIELDGTRDSIAAQDIDSDGFTALLDDALLEIEHIVDHFLLHASNESETDPLDWSLLEAWEAERGSLVQTSLDPTVESSIDAIAKADVALADEELHFDALQERLPLEWRRKRIEHQEQLLSQYLKGDVEPNSTKMTTLREQQSALDKLQLVQQKLLLGLPDRVSPGDWHEPSGDSSRFTQISQTLCQALLQEARLQNTVGDLSANHLRWIEQLVERPAPSYLRPVLACALMLATSTRSWRLSGYVTVRGVPSEDNPAAEHALLLYRPGQHGGLMVFDGESQLEDRLLKTLRGAWPETLLASIEPSDSDTLVQALFDPTSSNVTLNQVPIDSHFMDDCVQSILTSLPDASSRESARQRLCISEHLARTLAFERLAEQNRSTRMQEQLAPLDHLDMAQRRALAAQFDEQRQSLQAARALLRRSLPHREEFARHRLHHHLRQHFYLQQVPDITLDIADRVTSHKEVSGQSFGGGAGTRDVHTFSKERSKIPLESFLLWALDDDRRLRLYDAIVNIEPATNPELQRRLDHDFIANLVTQLDIAGAYEKRISEAFKGLAEESSWEAQWRQETLRAPYEGQLRLLALSRPTALGAQGLQLLQRFCREQVNSTAPRTVAYHPLVLKPGAAADGSSSSVGLSGIYVLKGETGPALLYLPSAPNGKVISQYDDTLQACRALETMAMDGQMKRFLANLAQDGEPADYESYIDTALIKQFSGFIEVGTTRPESLPTLEYSLEMGALIRKHRANSRSQADVNLASPVIFDKHFFFGLKLVLGFLPLAGATIALYDGWHAANASAAAFLRGDWEQGLEHLTRTLQSLTDAIVDIAPATAHPASPGTFARLRTQRRQRSGPLYDAGVIRKAYPCPFDGYEVEMPSGRLIEHPHQHGAAVLMDVDSQQHYISRHGEWYAVEWDSTYATWRLKGSRTRTYRQPVRLNEQGIWETPGALSGRLVDTGLAGGGGVLATLYDRGLLHWRALFTRQPARLSAMDVLRDIDNNIKRHKVLTQAKKAAYKKAIGMEETGLAGPPADEATVKTALSEFVQQSLAFLEFHEQSLDRLRGYRTEIARADYQRFKGILETNLGNHHVVHMRLCHQQVSEAYRQANLGQLTTESMGQIDIVQFIQTSIRAHRTLAESLSSLEAAVVRHHRIRQQLRGASLQEYDLEINKLDASLDPKDYRMARISTLAATLIRPKSANDPELGVFMPRLNQELRDLRNALFSHTEMASAGLSRAQERRLLTELRERYQRFVNHTRSWQDTYPDLTSPSDTQAFRQAMGEAIGEIDEQLARAVAASSQSSARRQRGPSRPRLFETVDQGALIGYEVTVDGQTQMQISQTISRQPHASFSRTEGGVWQVPRGENSMPSTSLDLLQSTAQKRLAQVASQQAKLRQYQTPSALPADLEDLAQGYGQSLRDLANAITRKTGDTITPSQETLVGRLTTSAGQMEALGRELRIAQTKATTQPNVGHLEYLKERGEIELAWSRTLEPAKDRHGNPTEYLEEYRVIDVQTQEPLWYAHFHFKRKPAQGFNRLEAGHLKLASERNLGSGAWRGVMSETQANALFGNLRPANR